MILRVSRLRDDIERKGGGGKLVGIKDCIDASIQGINKKERKRERERERAKKVWFQQPVTAILKEITWGQTEKQQSKYIENKNRKKSNVWILPTTD